MKKVYDLEAKLRDLGTERQKVKNPNQILYSYIFNLSFSMT